MNNNNVIPINWDKDRDEGARINTESIARDRARWAKQTPQHIQIEQSRAELLCHELNRDTVRAVIGEQRVQTIIGWFIDANPADDIPPPKPHLAHVAPIRRDGGVA